MNDEPCLCPGCRAREKLGLPPGAPMTTEAEVAAINAEHRIDYQLMVVEWCSERGQDIVDHVRDGRNTKRLAAVADAVLAYGRMLDSMPIGEERGHASQDLVCTLNYRAWFDAVTGIDLDDDDDGAAP